MSATRTLLPRGDLPGRGRRSRSAAGAAGSGRATRAGARPEPREPDGAAAAARPVAAAPAGPTADQVVVLQSIQEDPAVSLLLTTTPAERMTGQDAARVHRMALQARRRLREYGPPELVRAVQDQLDAAVQQAVESATSLALAVFASASHRQVLPLPVSVRSRVVVDPTFATRDLVRSLHRTPEHVVLVLNAGRARLFDGAGGVLRPAATEAFPMTAAAGDGTVGFLRRVDRALGAYRRLHPSPLVLVGPPRTLGAFTGLSRHADRLAGRLSGNLVGAPLVDIAARIGPVLEGYLRSREAEALALLEDRASAGAAVSGMPAAWLAARHERPEMLVVEEGLFYPARLTEDGDLVTPAADVTSPDVIDDLVDELIEVALRRGAWVALAADGALAAHDRVALTLRTGRR